MSYEVELKFPLADTKSVLAVLGELGAVAESPLSQTDLYFAHPSRDFAQSDEALRIRSTGESNCVTYKGPKIDPRTKTRREIEVPIASGTRAAEQFAEILRSLGFRDVRTVCKTRTPHQIPWQNFSLEVVIDEVRGLGTFLEIETTAEEANRDAARDAILSFADRLGLHNAERRSYLSLLLERDRGGTSAG